MDSKTGNQDHLNKLALEQEAKLQKEKDELDAPRRDAEKIQLQTEPLVPDSDTGKNPAQCGKINNAPQNY